MQEYLHEILFILSNAFTLKYFLNDQKGQH